MWPDGQLRTVRLLSICALASGISWKVIKVWKNGVTEP